MAGAGDRAEFLSAKLKEENDRKEQLFVSACSRHGAACLNARTPHRRL